MCLSFILNRKSKICGRGIILVIGYHLFFTVGPRFAPRAVSIGFMAAIVNICLCSTGLSHVIAPRGIGLNCSLEDIHQYELTI